MGRHLDMYIQCVAAKHVRLKSKSTAPYVIERKCTQKSLIISLSLTINHEVDMPDH